MRQCIERAFGMLVKRWGVFWRPLQCQFNRWATVTLVCAKLHNFCIDQGDTEPPEVRNNADVLPGDDSNRLDNNSSSDDPDSPNPAVGCTRRDLTSYLERIGAVRPAYAMANSRA